MPEIPSNAYPWDPGYLILEPEPLPGHEAQEEGIPGVLSLRQINDLLACERPYLADWEFRRLDYYFPHLRTLPQYKDIKMRIRATLEQEQAVWKLFLEENPDALKQEMDP